MVIAIDALDRHGMTQYEPECLVRETNKAFCGYLLNPNVEGEVGVAIRNWGCGVFGGDPEVKVMLQWLVASEAKRPFMSYYTFGLDVLEKLGPFAKWVESQESSVGEVWSRVVAYSGGTLRSEITVGFFEWLVPSLLENKPRRQAGWASPSQPGRSRGTRARSRSRTGLRVA